MARVVYPGNCSVTMVGVASYRVDSVLELVASQEMTGASVTCVLALVDDLNNTVTPHTAYSGHLTVTHNNANTKQLRRVRMNQ